MNRFLKKNLNASRPSEHPSVRGGNIKTIGWDHRLQITGLPNKWESIFKWERTATDLYVFKSELVNFEGTFGGYLYNCLFV